MLFYIFLAIVILLCITWITFLILYYLQEVRIHEVYKQFLGLLQQRDNLLPLLISLMNPYVVKGEDVFAKSLLLREKLRTSYHLRMEQELSHQFCFLSQVAEKHEPLLQDSRFQKVHHELEDIQKNIKEILVQYNKETLRFFLLKKKSLTTLFPGYFLFPHTSSLDFTA